MKTRKSIILFLFVIVAVACSDSAEETTVVVTDADIADTRAAGLNGQDYYWYQGKKIYLTRNEKYVNVVSGNGKLVKSSQVEAAAKAQTRSGDARYKLLPFFERGSGVEPIGTSDIFYLKLKNSEDIALLRKMADKLGVQVIGEIPHTPRWYTLSILGSEFDSSIEASNFFYETGQFEDVDPAFMFDFKPNADDSEFYKQWGMNNTSYPGIDINVIPAWNISRGAGIKVAVVDNPIDPGHDDLDDNIHALSYNAQLQQTPSASYSESSHGIHVAGIIAAEKNGSQVTGVAYHAQIVRVSHSISASNTLSAEMASGINWAWKSIAEGGAGVDVINCSWGDQGGHVYDQMHSTVLESAIIDAMTRGRYNKGTVVVFAAGNYGNYSPVIMDYPGNFHPDILNVGAIDNNGTRRYNSAYGTALDVVAPGGSIWSTIGGGGTGNMSGTSMAAPHVSGIAALILSRNPDLTQKQVTDLIEKYARKVNPTTYSYTTTYGRPNGIWNSQMGYGLVNAYESVRQSRFGIDFTITNKSNIELNNLYAALVAKVGGVETLLFTCDQNGLSPGHSIGLPFNAGEAITALPGTPVTDLRLELYLSASSYSPQEADINVKLEGEVLSHDYNYIDLNDGNLTIPLTHYNHLTVPTSGGRRMLNIDVYGHTNWSKRLQETESDDNLPQTIPMKM